MLGCFPLHLLNIYCMLSIRVGTGNLGKNKIDIVLSLLESIWWGRGCILNWHTLRLIYNYTLICNYTIKEKVRGQNGSYKCYFRLCSQGNILLVNTISVEARMIRKTQLGKNLEKVSMMAVKRDARR